MRYVPVRVSSVSTTRRIARAREKPQIAFRYYMDDSAAGVTRQTVKRMAAFLGIDEAQVIHRALRELAAKVLPNYERDDGPLTVVQIREIRRHIPKGKKRSASSTLFEPARLL